MLEPHLSFSLYMDRRLHLGVTGSVAAYKIPDLIRRLASLGLRVSATLTDAGSRFVTPLALEAAGAAPLYHDLFNPGQALYGHLEPAQKAQAMAIVPASADFLAKMAHGLADDMLSCQALAFGGPLLVAPAMNPRLWSAEATRENMATLKRRGVEVIGPDQGPMACGEDGPGRLADPRAVTAAILRALSTPDLAGRNILVSLGPTREFFDAARFWSNPSTGLMGACLAMAAWLRGANLTVVKGPVEMWLPADMRVVPVTTAAEMREAMTDLWPGMDAAAMVAAVSDFSPVPHGPEKFKRPTVDSGCLDIPFTINRDILAALGSAKRPEQFLVGFCAETSDVLARAREKLVRKNCDLMVGNLIGRPGGGFAAQTNTVTLVESAGRTETWTDLHKTEIAWRIWDWLPS